MVIKHTFLNLSSIFISFLIVFLLFSCSENKKNQQEEIKKIPKTAEVLENNLKLRMGPNSNSAELGKLAINSKIRILGRSISKMKIGSMKDYWYKIITKDGQKGWTYGAYLSVGENSHDLFEKRNQNRKEKISTSIRGRWFAVYQSGQLTRIFMSIYKDNKIDFGFGKTASQRSEYEIEYTPNISYVRTSKLKHPILKDISIELRGGTLVVKAMYGKIEYVMRRTELHPKRL